MSLMVPDEIIDPVKERETVTRWLNIKEQPSTGTNYQFNYIDIIKEGIATKSVNYFLKHTNLTKKQLGKLIHVSTRTLQRNDPGKKLDINSSERLLQLARLFYKGEEIFGSTDRFGKWLESPNLALGNKKPIDFLETGLGSELVMDELLRIDFGVFS